LSWGFDLTLSSHKLKGATRTIKNGLVFKKIVKVFFIVNLMSFHLNLFYIYELKSFKHWSLWLMLTELRQHKKLMKRWFNTILKMIFIILMQGYDAKGNSIRTRQFLILKEFQFFIRRVETIFINVAIRLVSLRWKHNEFY